MGSWETYLHPMAGPSKGNGRAETGDTRANDDDVQSHCGKAGAYWDETDG